MKAALTALAAALTLGAVLAFGLLSRSDAPPPSEPKPGAAPKPKGGGAPGPGAPGSAQLPGAGGQVAGEAPPRPAAPEPEAPAPERFKALIAAHTKAGELDGHMLDTDLARDLFSRPGDTLAAVEVLLEQRDWDTAHAMARGIAGTLVNQQEARARVVAAIRSGRDPVLEDAALYALLTSQRHDEVQGLLVDLYTDTKRSEKVRTSAAFIMREGLSDMSPAARQTAREQARSVLAPGAQSASSAGLKVESIAILGGHPELEESDRGLMLSALQSLETQDELDVTLAMLIRHQTPPGTLYDALQQRIDGARNSEQQAMFQEALRRTQAALQPTGNGPLMGPQEGPRGE